jgi:predicted metal-dependent hydrolase
MYREQPLAIDICVNPRARRLTLRVDIARHRLKVTVPPGVPSDDVSAFVHRHRDWAERRLAAAPASIRLTPGALIPVLGRPHRIIHANTYARTVQQNDGVEGPSLLVGGPPDAVPRRIGTWLKAQAKAQINGLAHAKAALITRQIRSITIRDTRSRWGSCSQDGRLSFSWRLILAPLPALDYVVAHEVAHLVELNHSPAFWSLCEQLASQGLSQRDWLNRHASELWRYRLD